MVEGDPKDRVALCRKPAPENLVSCVDGVLCALCLIKLGRTKDLNRRGALWCERCQRCSLVEVRLSGLLCSRCRVELASNPMSWRGPSP